MRFPHTRHHGLLLLDELPELPRAELEVFIRREDVERFNEERELEAGELS